MSRFQNAVHGKYAVQSLALNGVAQGDQPNLSHLYSVQQPVCPILEIKVCVDTTCKEGIRIKRWELDYNRFVNDARNVLSMEKVMEEIAQTFENNAIEQEKMSLICPLTKERIVTPVRYRTCRHFQCFDLKGFFSMKAKRNFLACPICNSKLDNELNGLCIDKYFHKMLSEVIGATETDILSDGTFRAARTQSALIIPKVIDDEEPYAPDHSTTHIGQVKLETDINVDDIEELDSVLSFDIDTEANESDAETENVLVPNAYMAGDITVQAENSTSKKAGLKIDKKRLQCGDCFYFTKDTHRLLRHRRIHTSEKTFKCTQCSYANAYAHVLKTHMLTHTGEKPYKCSLCSYDSAKSSNLKRHMRTHTGEKPYKCSQCSFAGAQSSDLKRHMGTHNGKKAYKCSECSHVTADSGHLKRHMLTHTGEKPHKCDKCSYTCIQAAQVKIHMHIHTGEKSYKCDQCSYAFTDSGSLKKHMRTHTGEKPYKCDQCSFASARSDALKTHIRLHTGEKPFKCSQCTFAAVDSRYLLQHSRIHTGEKRFKCQQCTYASVFPNDLKRHMRTHTGEKPFKCGQCSYESARADHLKNHMLTHTGEKPYKYSQCSNAGLFPAALKNTCSRTVEKNFSITKRQWLYTFVRYVG